MIELLKSNKELWNLFTKREEYGSQMLDQYERFPYYLSEHRNLYEPKVSSFLIQNGLTPGYPNGKKFGVCLTHDIDVVYKFVPSLREITLSLRKLQLNKTVRILQSKVTEYNPFWNFKQIMKLEEKYDAKSSFYFLALDDNDLDFNFRIEELKDELRNIVSNGWEVGLHGGHEAYNNLNELKKQKEKLEKVLGKKVIGYRNHYLRFKIPVTWKLLKEAGFKYDTTFGYADCVGFRNGLCHPFKPFDLTANKFINILEIPLCISDFTFPIYMRVDTKKAWEITKRLIDVVEKYKGVFTLVWHNTYMTGENLEFYKKILGYCYEKNAWMTSGEDIYYWWNKNNFLQE